MQTQPSATFLAISYAATCPRPIWLAEPVCTFAKRKRAPGSPLWTPNTQLGRCYYEYAPKTTQTASACASAKGRKQFTSGCFCHTRPAAPTCMLLLRKANSSRLAASATRALPLPYVCCC